MKTNRLLTVAAASMSAVFSATALAGIIGVDAVHGFDSDHNFARGSDFDQFRSTITGLGHSIVALQSFESGDLVDLDGLILMQPYLQNNADFAPSEMAAIQDFVDQRAVFLSDTSLWADPDVPGAVRPITFGDNQLLLSNIVTFISSGGGLLVNADTGGVYQVDNLNDLVSPWGISYSKDPAKPDQHTITDFVDHPVTNGLGIIGITSQRTITTNEPSISLTTGVGNDNALSTLVPEPTTLSLILLGGLILTRRR